MLKAPILILVLLQVLNLNAAPTEDDYYYYDEYDYDLEDTEFGSENICQLPKELGYSGKISHYLFTIMNTKKKGNF